MVCVCLSFVLLVLVYAHGPSEWALGDPVWTSVIISGFLVNGSTVYDVAFLHTFICFSVQKGHKLYIF